MLRLQIFILLIAASLHAPQADAEPSVDLIGSWHVLAHYKDDGTEHPERERWIDRVWKFEWEGERLKWTDYPIVVFDDETGRFERLGSNRQSRVLSFWQPNESQLKNIRKGLEVNPRGAKSKTLRGSDEQGWTSANRARPQSMTFISYVETWSVAGLTGLPVFTRADSMSSGMTDTLEGKTLYTTEHLEQGGNVLRGRFERDGTQHGTFILMRSGGPQWVKGSGKSDSERFYETFFGKQGGALLAGLASEGDVQSQIAKGEVSDELRREIRKEIRAGLEDQMRAAGRNPRTYKGELDQLTRRIETLLIDERKSEAEIRKLLAEGRLGR